MKLLTSLGAEKYFIRLTSGIVSRGQYILSINEHHLGYYMESISSNIEVNVAEATRILVKEDRGVK